MAKATGCQKEPQKAKIIAKISQKVVAISHYFCQATSFSETPLWQEIATPEGCPSENRIFGQMSHFWTKEGLFGEKRRVLGQKCRVLGQKGGFLDKSRIFGQDKFTDGQPWCKN